MLLCLFYVYVFHNMTYNKINEIQLMYSSLHGEPLLSMCRKPADIDNHTWSLIQVVQAVQAVQVSVISFTGVHHSWLGRISIQIGV